MKVLMKQVSFPALFFFSLLEEKNREPMYRIYVMTWEQKGGLKVHDAL